MNQAETAYAAELDLRRLAGEILLWRYECIRLRLGHRCWLLPDFWILAADCGVELHEVKGFMEDDARVKLSAAAAAFPELRFVLAKATRRGGVWSFAVSEVTV